MIKLLFTAALLFITRTPYASERQATDPGPDQPVAVTGDGSRNAIEDKKWLLTELMGRKIEPAADGHKAFIRFESDQSRITGNAGCNSFFGTYVLQEGDRIRFSDRMASTRMACPDMDAERRFLDALRTVDNFSLTGETLTLNRGRMAPLMRFEVAGDTD